MPQIARTKQRFRQEKEVIEPGTHIVMHRPSQCNHHFPVTKQPIHRKEENIWRIKESTMVPEANGMYRRLIVPKKEKNLYPAVWHKSFYDKLRQKAHYVSKEQMMEDAKNLEEKRKREVAAADARKEMFKVRQKRQPGLGLDEEEKELKGPDQRMHTLNRADLLKAEELPGARITNQMILAAKCHAIRDAQLIEKEVIKKELSDEEKRLDAMMDECRVLAIKREEETHQKRKDKLMEGLNCITQQISMNERSRVLEAERREEESVRMNQAIIAMQIDEAEKLKKKFIEQHKLKKQLDLANHEVLYFKQVQLEEERIMNERIQKFKKQKETRETKIKNEKADVLAAKEKAIELISKVQKEEAALRDELERIRNIKIQEDVEREYRRKERNAAIKKHEDNKALFQAREQQIRDIRRTIATEISKDEALFKNTVRQNELDITKEEALKKKKQDAVEKHRQEIMKQISDNEKSRNEERERAWSEGKAMRMEIHLQEGMERQLCLNKIQEMRQQGLGPTYVAEVQQKLAKMNII